MDREYLALQAAIYSVKENQRLSGVETDAIWFIKQHYGGPDKDIQSIFKLTSRLIGWARNREEERQRIVDERGPLWSEAVIENGLQWAIRKLLEGEPYAPPTVVYRDGKDSLTFDNDNNVLYVTKPRVQMFSRPIIENDSLLISVRGRNSKHVLGQYIQHRKGKLNLANFTAEYLGEYIVPDFNPNGFTKYLGSLKYTGEAEL